MRLPSLLLDADPGQDYYATPYVAEIVNTTTNLWFQYLAYRGIKNCLDQGHDGIFITTFLGYGLIGLGSFLFHMTLKCMLFCSMHDTQSRPRIAIDKGQIHGSWWTSFR